jgi:acetyl esterase/lipase
VARRALTAVAAVLVAIAAAVAIVAITRDGGDEPERFTVGHGLQSAVVVRGTRPRQGRPVVVFLHGWTAIDPRAYDAWVRHLAERGADVVLPVYQRPPFIDVRTPLPNVLAALRAAFARLPQHGPVIAAGHSAGGALSADWAASARDAGLPRPVAVYAVYPGRDLGPGLRLRGPSLRRIDPRTRVLALASPRDAVVGTAVAEETIAEPTQIPLARRTLRIVRDPSVQDHNAPARADPAAQQTFWSPLDRLIDAGRPSQAQPAPY